MAFTRHADSQRRHPMHFDLSRTTPPPLRGFSASEGHTPAPCGSRQAWQNTDTKRPDIPPLVFMLIQLFRMEWFLLLTPAQISMHVKHPIHLFSWFAFKTFAKLITFFLHYYFRFP
jgi:hypothetical protein